MGQPGGGGGGVGGGTSLSVEAPDAGQKKRIEKCGATEGTFVSMQASRGQRPHCKERTSERVLLDTL